MAGAPTTGKGPRLDMTAMVDVAFLLLTFFMLTTQFKAPAPVEVVLPSSNTEIKLPGTNILTIHVGKEEGQLFVGAGETEGQRIRMEDLTDVLVQLRTANPAVRTVIRADQEVKAGEVEDVMEALKEARITRFALVTSLEGAGAPPATGT